MCAHTKLEFIDTLETKLPLLTIQTTEAGKSTAQAGISYTYNTKTRIRIQRHCPCSQQHLSAVRAQAIHFVPILLKSNAI